MEKINIFDFVKKYLSILGVPAEQLDSQIEKVFQSVVLLTFKQKSISEQQETIVKNTADLLGAGKKEQSLNEFKLLFDSNESEDWKKIFISNLTEYLVGLTEILNPDLDDESRKGLANLINSL